ncbi:hypothetical protein [uncultured Paracoccus sp.]|uniref:hypothetical protein n=1 Tax=uncultured Paracoccus sp. TaxID=189685 RepID=UPI00262817E9|nr:hypothetical protein [uncultured Paracoccus sp.]
MSTQAAPDFALSFSNDAVHLLERTAPSESSAHWREQDRALFDATDFRDQIARLRAAVRQPDGSPAPVQLVIPDDQILYTSVNVDEPPRDEDEVGRALDGLTPYPVHELAWDWRSDGEDGVRVAAVARQTLREAEDFARRHGFAPGGFVADPPDGTYPGAPRFIMPGTPVQPAANSAPSPAASQPDAVVPTGNATAPTQVAAATRKGEPDMDDVLPPDVEDDADAGARARKDDADTKAAARPDPASGNRDRTAAAPTVSAEGVQGKPPRVAAGVNEPGTAAGPVQAETESGEHPGRPFADGGVDEKSSTPPDAGAANASTKDGVTADAAQPGVASVDPPAEDAPPPTATAGAPAVAKAGPARPAREVTSPGAVAGDKAAKKGAPVTPARAAAAIAAAGSASATVGSAKPLQSVGKPVHPVGARGTGPARQAAGGAVATSAPTLARGATSPSRLDAAVPVHGQGIAPHIHRAPPGTEFARKPGQRGGTGTLLLMLGALIVGLALIWGFGSSDPEPLAAPVSQAVLDADEAATVTSVPLESAAEVPPAETEAPAGATGQDEPAPPNVAELPSAAAPDAATTPATGSSAVEPVTTIRTVPVQPAPPEALSRETSAAGSIATGAASPDASAAGSALTAAEPASTSEDAPAISQSEAAVAQLTPDQPIQAEPPLGESAADQPADAAPATASPITDPQDAARATDGTGPAAQDDTMVPAAGNEAAIVDQTEPAARPDPVPQVNPADIDAALAEANAAAADAPASAGTAPVTATSSAVEGGEPGTAASGSASAPVDATPASPPAALPSRPAPARPPATSADPPPTASAATSGTAPREAPRPAAKPARPEPAASVETTSARPEVPASGSGAAQPAPRPRIGTTSGATPPPATSPASPSGGSPQAAPEPAPIPSGTRPPRRPESAALIVPRVQVIQVASMSRLAPAVWPRAVADFYTPAPRLAELRPTRRPKAAGSSPTRSDAVTRSAIESALTQAAAPPRKARDASPASTSSAIDAAVAEAASVRAVAAANGRPVRSPRAGKASRSAGATAAAVTDSAAVDSAVAAAVSGTAVSPGGVSLASLGTSPSPRARPRITPVPSGDAGIGQDSTAEAIALAAARSIAAPGRRPEEIRRDPDVAPPANAPVAGPPAGQAAQADRQRIDQQLQSQAEQRARAQATADARRDAEARAAAEARARSQAAAEERAAIARTGSYKPPEADAEPEVAATTARTPQSNMVTKNATVGGLDLGKTQVIGVIGAGRASRALIRLRSGKIVTVRLGDKIDGGPINAIGKGRVSYVKGGRQHDLPILGGR